MGWGELVQGSISGSYCYTEDCWKSETTLGLRKLFTQVDYMPSPFAFGGESGMDTSRMKWGM